MESDLMTMREREQAEEIKRLSRIDRAVTEYRRKERKILGLLTGVKEEDHLSELEYLKEVEAASEIITKANAKLEADNALLRKRLETANELRIDDALTQDEFEALDDHDYVITYCTDYEMFEVNIAADSLSPSENPEAHYWRWTPPTVIPASEPAEPKHPAVPSCLRPEALPGVVEHDAEGVLFVFRVGVDGCEMPMGMAVDGRMVYFDFARCTLYDHPEVTNSQALIDAVEKN